MVKTDPNKVEKMGFFRKKEKEEKSSEKETKEPKSQLESLCQEELELYVTFHRTLLLDPARIQSSWKELIKKAEDERKKGNIQRAWNFIIESIQITLWTEDGQEILQKVIKKALREEFRELHQRRYVDHGGNLRVLLKDPERTMAISREYYREKRKEYREKEAKEKEEQE